MQRPRPEPKSTRLCRVRCCYQIEICRPISTHAVTRQPQEVADVYGVSLHRDIQSFLPFGQSSRIIPSDDGAVTNVVDYIIEFSEWFCTRACSSTAGISGFSIKPNRAVARQ